MNPLLLLSAALVVLALPHTASAQTADHPSADELQARLDELRPQRDAANEAARAREERDMALQRSAAAAVATVDTIHVGMMTIVTPTDQVDAARELFSEVWEESFAHIGHSPELERAWFTFQWSDIKVPIHIEEHPRPVELSSRWTRRSNAQQRVREAIAATINFDLRAEGTLVGRWIGGNPLQPPSYGRVYQMIATTESYSTRACLDGDIAECVNGLRLTLPPWPRFTIEMSDEERFAEQERFEAARTSHLRGWYTPEERRSLAVRASRGRPSRDSQELWGRCVEASEIDACDTFLIQWSYDRAPMDGSVRESFMAYAIQQGDSGAWGRLLARPELPALEALEYASGQSIEDLAAGWRAQVLANRPETFASLFPRSGLAILWFVFFSAFAMRNTRWRMG